MTAVNTHTQSTLAFKLKIADTPLTRMKGLLDRDSLDKGEGLLITGCQSIHMLFMKFPIDVVFLDKTNTVVGICPNIQPFHFSPIFWHATSALELPPGTIQATNTQLTHHIQIQK